MCQSQNVVVLATVLWSLQPKDYNLSVHLFFLFGVSYLALASGEAGTSASCAPDLPPPLTLKVFQQTERLMFRTQHI